MKHSHRPLDAYRHLLCLICLLLLAGCAGFSPRPKHEVPYLDRARTKVDGEVQVTVAVPTIEESEQIFGVPLADHDIQPVWLQIRNNDDGPYWFAPIGMDPSYFSPHEASWKTHLWFGGEANKAMDAYFLEHHIHPYAGPGTTVSGFVFTHLDQGAKRVNVDLIGYGRVKSFYFIVPVPGLRADYQEVDFARLYKANQIVRIDDQVRLRQWLAGLPCCALGKDGKGKGDPLNLVLVGQRRDIASAFLRRGWDLTETIHGASVWKTVKSFLFGTAYRYSPVSPLYLFDRPQDLALQKARDTVNERNHLRLWLTPVRFRGVEVWVGQISRDIGVRFTGKLVPLTTHAIDPAVDEARFYLVQDLLLSQGVAGLGYVEGVGTTSPDAPRQNLLGDPYYTDGLRVVFMLTGSPTSVTGVRLLPWASPRNVRRDGRPELGE